MRAIPIVLVLALAGLPSADAACTVTSTAPLAETDTPLGHAYVTEPKYCFNGDLDYKCKPFGDCTSPCLDPGGLFLESNGLLGLQRWWDETCGAPADDLVTFPSIDLP